MNFLCCHYVLTKHATLQFDCENYFFLHLQLPILLQRFSYLLRLLGEEVTWLCVLYSDTVLQPAQPHQPTGPVRKLVWPVHWQGLQQGVEVPAANMVELVGVGQQEEQE